MKKNSNNNKYQVFVLKNTTKAKTKKTTQKLSLNNVLLFARAKYARNTMLVTS